METDAQRLARFHADFEKLKHNREKVPLQQLTTRYARSYNTLVAEVMDGAVWFYRKCVELEEDFPTHPEDKAGNEWLARCLTAIGEDERKPGGLIDQFRAALIDRLDMDAYHDLVNETYEPRLRVFNRYWSRHCMHLESGWIYNRILKKFWWPQTKGCPGSGCWINSDYSGRDYRFPPQLKEETKRR